MRTKAMMTMMAAGVLSTTLALPAAAAEPTTNPTLSEELVNETLLADVPIVTISYTEGRDSFRFTVEGSPDIGEIEVYDSQGGKVEYGAGEQIHRDANPYHESVRYLHADLARQSAPFRPISGFEVDVDNGVIRFDGNGSDRRAVYLDGNPVELIVASDPDNRVPGCCTYLVDDDGHTDTVVYVGDALSRAGTVTVRSYGPGIGRVENVFENPDAKTHYYMDHTFSLRTEVSPGTEIRDNGDGQKRIVFTDAIPNSVVRVSVRRNGTWIGNHYGIADANGYVFTSGLVMSGSEMAPGDVVTIGERMRDDNGTYIEPDWVAAEVFTFTG